MPSRPGSILDRAPAPVLFVVSGLTQYLGAAIAVGLFAVIAPATIAWLRIIVAAAVLLTWRRPWRAAWTRGTLLTAVAFGVVLAAMNVTFYIAIDHLPLGTAVAIEFLGPVVVAAITGRGRRERAGVVLAALGVVLLASATLRRGGGPDVVLGLVAIGAAAACWAGYILLGRRVAVRGSGVTSLAVAMTAGALVFAPFLAAGAAPVLTDWRLALAVLGVAVLSSVIPYAIEQVVLRRVSAATFAVLLALLPATAAVMGAVVLHQFPTLAEGIGLLAVSGAIALASARSSPQSPTTP
ncbi:EamA family transporter [Pengzhenrongella sp.]|uniref:EamA family transporter n=1 Tax=Pengzhenrongella sp. TaxID=2888820 RepID=UPI002F92EC17